MAEQKLKAIEKYIYCRGDGQYLIRFRKKGYPPVSATRPTIELAREWLAVTQSSLYRHEYVKQEKIEIVTFGFCLKKYGEEKSNGKKGEKQELVIINRLIGNLEANPPIKPHPLTKKPISQIEASDIEKYIDERRNAQSQRDKTKRVSDATIRLEVMLMSAVFTSAKSKKWNYFKGANPVSEIDGEHKLGKSTERTRRFIGDEEKKLLAELDKHCRNRDIPLVVRFAVATAARQSEIIGKAATSKAQATPGLTWERIDLKMRSATFTDTKNGKDRVIPLGDAAYAILSSLLRPIKGGKIFNVTQDGLIRAMQTCTKSAEIEDFTFHDLRHEATSRMIEDGMPTVIVQKITGHSNAEMLKRYTHLDILKQAMTMR